MTTSSPSITLVQTTNAEFRAWGLAVSTALGAIGLTQTSDTGQINWTTVATPAGASASQGYEIWRFNDTLQATKPLFFKIEYGSGGAATSPAIWMTVGAGSDGAGTITGAAIMTRAQKTFNSGVATAFTSYFCYSTTLGALWFFIRGTNGQWMHAIMRTCDTDETPNSEGVHIGTSNTNYGGGSGTSYLWRYDTNVQLNPTGWWGIPGTASSMVTLNTGLDSAVFQFWAWVNKVVWFPGVLGCLNTDYGAFTTVLATPYTTQRTYIALTGNTASGGPTSTDNQGQAACKALWLWE